jgi:hypothetical protein
MKNSEEWLLRQGYYHKTPNDPDFKKIRIIELEGFIIN